MLLEMNGESKAVSHVSITESTVQLYRNSKETTNRILTPYYFQRNDAEIPEQTVLKRYKVNFLVSNPLNLAASFPTEFASELGNQQLGISELFLNNAMEKKHVFVIATVSRRSLSFYGRVVGYR